MNRIPALSLPLFIALAAHAQLPPQADAPLYRHMTEVNAQWQTMGPALANDPAPVHFSNEAERIARHLHLVAAHLRAHTPEGLSAGASAKRNALLDKLDAYADRGRFPRNQVLPCRNPVFIDPQGTACAVGQLMIESGHRDLAERISRTMNLAYIHDMKRADVLAWAGEEGFTEDELAWVQPGYPPTTAWSALGGGTNGPVQVMLNLPNGAVLVAGAFTQAGGIATNNVALWDGSSFTALGAGVSGTILCGAALGNDIYLGGSGIGGNNDLAHWDGTQWSFTTVFQGKFPQLFALHVLNDTLFAAGESQGFAGADDYVARYTGSEWQPLPGVFDAPVRCLADHNGQLVAGGEFTSATTDGSPLVTEHVATFGPDGWSEAGDGLNGAVLALLNDEGMLYAGGAMYGDASPVFGLARIANGASAWEPLMPNLGDYIAITPGTTQVRTLLSDGGHIYVGGDFETIMVMTMGRHLMRFLGSPDGFEPLAYFNGPVNALASNPFISDAIGLYAGGEFTLNVNDSLPYLAEAVLSTGIHGPAKGVDLAIHPNPASDRLTVMLGTAISGPATLHVADAQGRTVLTRHMGGNHTEVDIARLAAGAYTLVVTGEGQRLSRPFIKR